MNTLNDMIENNLAAVTSLDGAWRFALGGAPERDITVPSAWEASDVDRITDGPARFQPHGYAQRI